MAELPAYPCAHSSKKPAESAEPQFFIGVFEQGLDILAAGDVHEGQKAEGKSARKAQQGAAILHQCHHALFLNVPPGMKRSR